MSVYYDTIKLHFSCARLYPVRIRSNGLSMLCVKAKFAAGSYQ